MTITRETYAPSAISEETRISFTTQLNQLREDPQRDELAFPPTLDNIERKFLHALAGQLGLVSKSRGKGDGKRYITVTKKKKKGNDDEEEDLERYPHFSPGQESAELLRSHSTRHPLSERERATMLALCVSRSDSATTAGDAAADTDQGHRGAVRAADKQAPKRSSQNNTAASGGQTNQNPSKKQLGYYDPATAEQLQAKRRASHAAAQAKRDSNAKYKGMVQARQRLPAWQHAEMVAQLVKENQVVVVSGETGCGKSTQVPQFMLDDPEIGPGLKMAVTQPRRISAIAVAERVAAERLEDCGKTVGYNIRLESEVSENTQVVFMTPGVLLRKLSGDPHLREFTHIMIDEVHERDRNTDFLLIILRDLLLYHRPTDLRLILMSATLQTAKLSAYFSGCPVATIGSTCYPVQEFYLEDVLLQTNYVTKRLSTSKGGAGGKQKSGGGGGGGSGGKSKGPAASDDPLLRALCHAAPVYTCDMCGKRGFRSPEEFGTHIVLCDGVAVEGGATEEEEAALQGLEAKLLQDLQHEEDYVPDYEDWTNEAAAPVAASGPLAALAGGGSGDDGEFVADAEDEGGPPYRHSALEGEGVLCPMPTATEVQAQEALRLYQFDFDDENVDYQLIQELLVYIVESGYEPGAILVFLPGWDDISRLREALRRDPLLGREDKFLVLPLHSGIPSKQQREVFKRPPPGVRKIVLATNIAETSITIDDVTFVVDSGRVKEKNYDPFLKLCTLQPTWISKASARQRRGRAGRTTAGVCFHLCSRRRYESLREFKESELLTTPLEELCLQAKLLGVAPGYDPLERHVVKKKKKPAKRTTGAALLASLSLSGGQDADEEAEEDEADQELAALLALRLEGDSIMGFLGKALDAPHDLSVKNAIDLLVQIGAFTSQEQLTDLGHKLARLPMDPRIGKMVLWGQLLGCGRSALKVGCALAYRDPFVLPLTADAKARANKAKQELAGGCQSDHLALLGAVNGYETAIARGGMQASFGYCDRYFLSRSTLATVVDVVKQMVNEMCNMGFASPLQKSFAVEHDHNLALLTAVVCAGLYPGVASRNVGDTNFTTTCQKKAKLHQSSVNCHSGSRFTRVYTSDSARALGGGPEFLVFSEVLRTPSLFVMSGTTPVPLMSLLLLCGDLKMRGCRSLLETGHDGPKASPPQQDAGDDDEEEEESDDGEGSLGDQALLILDDWITFRCPKPMALQLQALRLRLHQAFLAFVKHPQTRLSETCQDALRATVRLLTLENPYMSSSAKLGGVGGGGGGGGGYYSRGGDGRGGGGGGGGGRYAPHPGRICGGRGGEGGRRGGRGFGQGAGRGGHPGPRK